MGAGDIPRPTGAPGAPDENLRVLRAFVVKKTNYTTTLQERPHFVARLLRAPSSSSLKPPLELAC